MVGAVYKIFQTRWDKNSRTRIHYLNLKIRRNFCFCFDKINADGLSDGKRLPSAIYVVNKIQVSLSTLTTRSSFWLERVLSDGKRLPSPIHAVNKIQVSLRPLNTLYSQNRENGVWDLRLNQTELFHRKAVQSNYFVGLHTSSSLPNTKGGTNRAAIYLSLINKSHPWRTVATYSPSNHTSPCLPVTPSKRKKNTFPK